MVLKAPKCPLGPLFPSRCYHSPGLHHTHHGGTQEERGSPGSLFSEGITGWPTLDLKLLYTRNQQTWEGHTWGLKLPITPGPATQLSASKGIGSAMNVACDRYKFRTLAERTHCFPTQGHCLTTPVSRQTQTLMLRAAGGKSESKEARNDLALSLANKSF